MTATAAPVPPTPHEVPEAHRAELERALELLCDAALDPIVDMVCLHRDGRYEAHSHDGMVAFRRHGDGFERVAVEGADPLADQGTERFAPLAEERLKDRKSTRLNSSH